MLKKKEKTNKEKQKRKAEQIGKKTIQIRREIISITNHDNSWEKRMKEETKTKQKY